MLSSRLLSTFSRCTFLAWTVACGAASTDSPGASGNGGATQGNGNVGGVAPDRGGAAGSGGSSATGGDGTRGGSDGGGSGDGPTIDDAGGPTRDASATREAGTFDAANIATDAPTSTGTAYVYTSGYDAQITIFTLDMTAGTLTPRGSAMTGFASPICLAISPDKHYLYASNEASGASSKVAAFKINAADGSLERINDAPAGGDGAAHVSVHPSGQLVFVADYDSGQVATLKVAPNGGLTTPPADVQTVTLTNHQVVSDATGKYLFVPNPGSNTIFQFMVDVAAAKLIPNGQVTGFPASTSPRHISFHPTQSWAYTINESSDTTSSLTYDPTTGKLSDPQTISSLPDGVTPSRMYSGGHVLVHPSGHFVYTSNRGHDSISIFDVNPTTGRLTMSGNETAGGTLQSPRDFAIDETGKFLVVGNEDSATLGVFAIGADGKLSAKGTAPTRPMPTYVGIVFL